MNREKDLAKNTIIIFVGTACTKLIQFFLLPLYTYVLTTSEYGTIDLFNTLVQLAIPIIGLQIEQGLFRYLIDNRDNEKKKRELISTGISFIIISICAYLLLFFIINYFIKNQYKYFLIINIIACLFSSLFLQIARGLGKNKNYSIAGFITATTIIIFNILFLVVIKLKVEGMLLATLIGYITGIIYLFITLKINKYCFKKDVNINTLKELIKYSFPLVPNQISWWIFNTSDRVIVSWLLGMSYTGILSVSYKFSSTYILLYNIFNMSWTESIALHINDKDAEKYFNRTFNVILNIFTSIGICLISFMPIIFRILINSKYNDAYCLIPILILATMCQVIVGLVSVIYVAKNDTKSIANTAIISAIINISVHLALIKFIGLYAAAVSTFVSYFAFAIYRTIDVSKKYIKVKFNKKNIIFSIIVLLVVLVSYYYYNRITIMVSIIISICYAVMINRNSINSIKNFIIKKIRKN